MEKKKVEKKWKKSGSGNEKRGNKRDNIKSESENCRN